MYINISFKNVEWSSIRESDYTLDMFVQMSRDIITVMVARLNVKLYCDHLSTQWHTGYVVYHVSTYNDSIMRHREWKWCRNLQIYQEIELPFTLKCLKVDTITSVIVYSIQCWMLGCFQSLAIHLIFSSWYHFKRFVLYNFF